MATSNISASSTHSRDSSTNSSLSMPATPTFPARTHNHWPSSSSSLADASIMNKSHLGDLLEETEELDDFDGYWSTREQFNEDLCMCDTPFCVHEPRSRHRSSTTTPVVSPGSSIVDDDAFLHADTTQDLNHHDITTQAFSSRISRRLSSISRRWRDLQATTSLSTQHQSATPPRSNSLRLPKVRTSLAHVLNTSSRLDRSLSVSSSIGRVEMPSASLDITAPPTPISEEPIDRQSMSRTPLLPPSFNDFRNNSDNHVLRSPLQSPSVASIQSPLTVPITGVYTPPLSTSPSCSSFHRFNHIDIPPMDLGIETDPWAIKLGHANFFIYPEPYIPTEHTGEACQQILDDWETARTEYMRQAARIRDDYGSNSQTFHLTEEKWAEIDAQWRTNHKLVNERAQASGEAVKFQPLAETAPPQKMPTISHDPNAPAKFPVIDESDIVGPMVQFAKIAGTSPAKKSGLLRIFTDSTSILSKPRFQLRR